MIRPTAAKGTVATKATAAEIKPKPKSASAQAVHSLNKGLEEKTKDGSEAPALKTMRAAKQSREVADALRGPEDVRSHSSSSTSRPNSVASSRSSGSRSSRSSRGSRRSLHSEKDQDLHTAAKRELNEATGGGPELLPLTEEDAFLQVLDLLEQNDEFNSFSDDSEASSFDDEAETFESSETESEDCCENCRDERPLLADWELEAAWCELQNRRLPSIEVCRKIILEVIRTYRQEQNVVHVPAPEVGARMVVVGDIHGHFSDLAHILRENGEPQSGPGGVRYIFNGDFVDRGAWGPECLMAIYCLKCKCPDCVFLNRGNHEDQQQNLKPDNGFIHSHCIRAFGADSQRMYSLCKSSFKVLPLCHVINNEIAVIHGGLPLDPSISLADINAIHRRCSVPVGLCCILGYPRLQKVVAKRTLLTEDGEEVPAGRKGKLIERVGKSNYAVVKFSRHDEDVLVQLAGSPVHEKDVDIVYDSKDEEAYHRLNRLFVALLWSDPVASKSAVGPSKRGAGSCFDAKITQDFLRLNKLSLMLRSHEKRNDGFQEEHRSAKMGLMSATVFSASNYPSGAGEPLTGNKAAVVVLRCPKDGQSLSSTISGSDPWREAYDDGTYHSIRMSSEMKARFQAMEAVQTVRPRARALAKMRELTTAPDRSCSRTGNALTDPYGQGVVPVSAWARAMRACVVADDEFPWEWLKPYFLRSCESETAETFNYAAYLQKYENSLSRKLADQWLSGAVILMAKNVTSQEQVEAAWNSVDRNGDGKLSYQELRPLLRSSALQLTDADLEEDRVYSVLSKIDKDASGFVCKEEFMRAVTRALKFREIVNQSADSGESPDVSPLGLRHGSKSEKRRCRNKMLRKELAKWDETDIAHCWAATQGAVRALAATSGCASSVFQVLDSDGDGAIDRQEFQEGIQQLLRGSALLKSIDRWEPLLWKLVDEDGSGYVSPSELNMAFSVREFMSI
eukprot:CAMPEP_0181465160 /NCGR_PEP_ID=MMETSP1110-20121109/35808_1 /TAXON_ID=174948 /ORGANISM="Symbiodinium sp., Strain CCMP421" /LENGTH=962 /DNA_ID=CAMNT_0023589923 /DNA_START=56 /DNA_END=2946 /DNA_ORIENTATION=+